MISCPRQGAAFQIVIDGLRHFAPITFRRPTADLLYPESWTVFLNPRWARFSLSRVHCETNVGARSDGLGVIVHVSCM